MTEKTAGQQLQERLFTKKQHAHNLLDATEVEAFAQEYKTFLSENKTEREVITTLVALAEKAGFANIANVGGVEAGKTYYKVDNNKNLALVRFSGLKSIHAVASHVDSPCLHLKPYPLAESNKLGMLKTHYYGGVKKYQWLNIPLALRGVAHTQEGTRVDVRLGEDGPCFTIPDLLPHLAKDQLKKEAREVVSGEQLNAIAATIPYEDEKVKDKVKLALAIKLNEQYGLTEEDFLSAELSLLPAGPARDAGIDASLILGYGHDDRSCTYASARAILDAKKATHTQIALFYDKEEIGSYGRTGAQNLFMQRLIEELLELSETDLRPSQVWEKTNILSADVTAAVDPNFSDVHDPSNATYIGYGVAIEKYGGSGGKYSTNDADAEYMHALTTLFKQHNVPWQTGELGKVDQGGGGTIAMFLARHGANVVDMGPAVLGMHAPYELLAKHDLFSTYKAYNTFFEHSLPK